MLVNVTSVAGTPSLPALISFVSAFFGSLWAPALRTASSYPGSTSAMAFPPAAGTVTSTWTFSPATFPSKYVDVAGTAGGSNRVFCRHPSTLGKVRGAFSDTSGAAGLASALAPGLPAGGVRLRRRRRPPARHRDDQNHGHKERLPHPILLRPDRADPRFIPVR